jgi:hypothetical protein
MDEVFGGRRLMIFGFAISSTGGLVQTASVPTSSRLYRDRGSSFPAAPALASALAANRTVARGFFLATALIDNLPVDSCDDRLRFDWCVKAEFPRRHASFKSSSAPPSSINPMRLVYRRRILGLRLTPLK